MSKPILSFEPSSDLLAWAAPICGTPEWPPESVPLGILDRDSGRILAVFVLNAFYDNSCAIHLATDGGRKWATQNILGGVFGYIFIYLRRFRLNAVLPKHNILGQIAALKLGFVFEGAMRAGAADGSDAILMSMLAPECRWIKEGDGTDGQEIHTEG